MIFFFQTKNPWNRDVEKLLISVCLDLEFNADFAMRN